MKHLLTRILAFSLFVVLINFVSDWFAQSSEPEYEYLFGTTLFFRLLLILSAVFMFFLSFELYQFTRQKDIRKRNLSLGLLIILFIWLILFWGYFSEFAL